jgi:nucleotide-binding universal stress UspA family protein
MKRIERILIATDGSRASGAVEVGLELAAGGHAEVTFLHVAENAKPRHANWRHTVPRRLELAGDSVLEAAADAAHGRSIDFRSERFSGDPLAVIVGVAHSIDADLIVLGSSRRGRMHPSISRKLLRRTKRPVLVAPITSVRPKAAA